MKREVRNCRSAPIVTHLPRRFAISLRRLRHRRRGSRFGADLQFADWTIERIRREVEAIGPCTALLCEKILTGRPHSEQGFRAYLGIVRLVCDRQICGGQRRWLRCRQVEARMHEREPNIVTSGLSRPIIRDGVAISLEIYRLESEPEWSLEVVNDRGTSIVWDDRFETDDLALSAFEQVVADEGMATFVNPSNVVPLRR